MDDDPVTAVKLRNLTSRDLTPKNFFWCLIVLALTCGKSTFESSHPFFGFWPFFFFPQSSPSLLIQPARGQASVFFDSPGGTHPLGDRVCLFPCNFCFSPPYYHTFFIAINPRVVIFCCCIEILRETLPVLAE